MAEPARHDRFPLFRDRLPVALFTLYFAADLAVLRWATSWWLPVLWFGIGIIPKGWICSWNHHHQHLSVFRPAVLNRLLEVMYGFQTGVTSHAWFLHHVVGHHRNYLDQTKDESRWADDSGQQMSQFQYILTTVTTAYTRAFEVGKRHPAQQRIFVAMGLLQVALLTVAFALRPYNAFFVLALPMLVSLSVTVWATYFHHAGLHTDDQHAASYNIMHAGYNLATGNLGYHTAHHMRHGLHWSLLPQYHAEIAEHIAPGLYRQPGIPFVWSDAEAVVEPEFGQATS